MAEKTPKFPHTQIKPDSHRNSLIRVLMGFLSYAVSGGGFAVIGVWESLDSSNPDPNPNPSSSPTAQTTTKSVVGSSSSISVALLSSLFIANSIFSFFTSIGSHDRVGSTIQLQILPIAILFLIYAILTYLVNFVTLPSSITSLLLLFGFIEEFLLFYLQKKDTSGIENRYYDLMLVPIAICVFSTVFELRSDSKTQRFAKLGRGIGLILQGTWFLQMGVSFFTDLVTNNCTLHEKSRGDFTIKCRGHNDYHRAKAIATLQFNCHLALMVVLATGLFSVFANKNGYVLEDHSKYRPLGAEMGDLCNFTLDSDEEDEEIREENNNVAAKETGLNGIS